MSYVFDGWPALDPVTGFLAKDASFTIYAESDISEASPLPVLDASGTPLPGGLVKSGPQGVLATFIADPARVWAVSGGFKFLLTSTKGLEESAQAAAQAAAASASAAADSAANAFKIGRPGAVPPTWWGEFTTSNAPTASEGAVQGDLGVLLP